MTPSRGAIGKTSGTDNDPSRRAPRSFPNSVEVRPEDAWAETLPLPASLSRKALNGFALGGIVFVGVGLLLTIASLFGVWWSFYPLHYLTDRLFILCIAGLIVGSVLVLGGMILSLISSVALKEGI